MRIILAQLLPSLHSPSSTVLLEAVTGHSFSNVIPYTPKLQAETKTNIHLMCNISQYVKENNVRILQ